MTKFKFTKLRKALVTLFLTANLTLIATQSANLDSPIDSVQPDNQSAQSAQINQTSPTPTPFVSPSPSPVTSNSTAIPPTIDELNMSVDENGIIAERLAIKFKDEKEERSEGTQNILKAHAAHYIYESLDMYGTKIIKVKPESRKQLLNVLQKNPNVEYVEEYSPVYALEGGMGGSSGGGGSSACYLYFQANDYYFCNGDYQWALKTINAPTAWKFEKGDYPLNPPYSDVTIAIMDSGVYYPHYDLGLASYYIGNKVYKGEDVLYPFEYPNDPIDEDGHGTIVAGIAAAITNNNSGIAGAGYYAKILPMRVWQSPFSDPNILATGIRHAVDNYSNLNVKVMNISLGTDSDVTSLRNAIYYAVSKGVVIVAATANGPLGNANCFMGFPAAYTNVISVNATNRNDTYVIGCGSNYKNGTYYDKLWVSAPGDEIFTTLINSGIGYAPGTGTSPGAGTSLAAPFVSGLAALLASHPGRCSLTPSQIRIAIRYGSIDKGTAGWDMQYGQGRIDFWQAIDYYDCF